MSDFAKFFHDDKKFMKLALQEAKNAFAENEIPVGCVIVDEEGKILARAHNQKEALHDVTAHAEILAMRKAMQIKKNWRLKNCSLYVTLEPCPMCAGAINQARLSRVIYGVYDNELGACESRWRLLHETQKITAGIFEEECQKILQDFFEKQRENKND